MVYRSGGTRAVEVGDANRLDATFAALSHRGRRDLLRTVLNSATPLAMNDLAYAAGMSPQLLNKHASALERAGLISRISRGRERHVYAHPEVLSAAQHWIDDMTSYWTEQLDALQAYVADLGDAPTADTEEA